YLSLNNLQRRSHPFANTFDADFLDRPDSVFRELIERAEPIPWRGAYRHLDVDKWHGVAISSLELLVAVRANDVRQQRGERSSYPLDRIAIGDRRVDADSLGQTVTHGVANL